MTSLIGVPYLSGRWCRAREFKLGEEKAMRHTHYCEYADYCDKKIDCKHDEYCPVFTIANGLTVTKPEPCEDRGEFSMAQFWEE